MKEDALVRWIRPYRITRSDEVGSHLYKATNGMTLWAFPEHTDIAVRTVNTNYFDFISVDDLPIRITSHFSLFDAISEMDSETERQKEKFGKDVKLKIIKDAPSSSEKVMAVGGLAFLIWFVLKMLPM